MDVNVEDPGDAEIPYESNYLLVAVGSVRSGGPARTLCGHRCCCSQAACALISRTPTSRCHSATAGRQVRARESPRGAGRAATGTRVALRSRPLLPAMQHVRP